MAADRRTARRGILLGTVLAALAAAVLLAPVVSSVGFCAVGMTSGESYCPLSWRSLAGLRSSWWSWAGATAVVILAGGLLLRRRR